jgi:putative ABC transport system ATP-binding protein
MDAIQVEHVTKRYHVGAVETRALNDVSLSIGEGEFMALVGPSGSGKTTLLQLIGCLDKPDQGTVRIKGQDITRLSASQRADLRRTSIGFVFQFFALVPVLTAYENVELPLLLSGVRPAERRARVMDLLTAVGLEDRAHHRPDQLSGGQQQRVAIARALAPRPLMVLADEPTANLDTANGQQAMEIMARLNRETGTAFVYATHDPRVIAFARRVVTLVDGQIVKQGAPTLVGAAD